MYVHNYTLQYFTLNKNTTAKMLLLLAVYKLHKKVAHCAGYNVAKWYCRSDRHKRKVSILPFPSRYSPT